MPVLFYTLYLNSGVSRGVEEEIVVNVNIADENDNAPEFLTLTREIVGSVDSRAELGERVAKVEAWDPDVGLNADLRYFVHGAGADRFSIGAKGRYLLCEVHIIVFDFSIFPTFGTLTPRIVEWMSYIKYPSLERRGQRAEGPRG